MGEVESRSLESDWRSQPLESVVLENGALRVIVLPALGGKIASMQIKPGSEELLQQPLQPYAPRSRYMSFDASDASGWDECLPSVAACEVQTAAGLARVPDHGDFWQVEWEVVSQTSNELNLSAEGFSLPLQFTKTLRLDGDRLHVAYTLKNLSDKMVEYLWSAHPLFLVERGDRIMLPDSVREVTVEGSGKNRLGEPGTRLTWSKAAADLSVAGGVEDGVGDKLFTPAPTEGWCAIERRRLNRRVELQFDPVELPWLGLWLCYGGWPEHSAHRQQCVALEPCTAQGDSLAAAVAEGRARRLSANATNHWRVIVQVGGVS